MFYRRNYITLSRELEYMTCNARKTLTFNVVLSACKMKTFACTSLFQLFIHKKLRNTVSNRKNTVGKILLQPESYGTEI